MKRKNNINKFFLLFIFKWIKQLNFFYIGPVNNITLTNNISRILINQFLAIEIIYSWSYLTYFLLWWNILLTNLKKTIWWKSLIVPTFQDYINIFLWSIIMLNNFSDEDEIYEKVNQNYTLIDVTIKNELQDKNDEFSENENDTIYSNYIKLFWIITSNINENVCVDLFSSKDISLSNHEIIHIYFSNYLKIDELDVENDDVSNVNISQQFEIEMFPQNISLINSSTRDVLQENSLYNHENITDPTINLLNLNNYSDITDIFDEFLNEDFSNILENIDVFMISLYDLILSIAYINVVNENVYLLHYQKLFGKIIFPNNFWAEQINSQYDSNIELPISNKIDFNFIYSVTPTTQYDEGLINDNGNSNSTNFVNYFNINDNLSTIFNYMLAFEKEFLLNLFFDYSYYMQVNFNTNNNCLINLSHESFIVNVDINTNESYLYTKSLMYFLFENYILNINKIYLLKYKNLNLSLIHSINFFWLKYLLLSFKISFFIVIYVNLIDRSFYDFIFIPILKFNIFKYMFNIFYVCYMKNIIHVLLIKPDQITFLEFIHKYPFFFEWKKYLWQFYLFWQMCIIYLNTLTYKKKIKFPIKYNDNYIFFFYLNIMYTYTLNSLRIFSGFKKLINIFFTWLFLLSNNYYYYFSRSYIKKLYYFEQFYWANLYKFDWLLLQWIFITDSWTKKPNIIYFYSLFEIKLQNYKLSLDENYYWLIFEDFLSNNLEKKKIDFPTLFRPKVGRPRKINLNYEINNEFIPIEENFEFFPIEDSHIKYSYFWFLRSLNSTNVIYTEFYSNLFLNTFLYQEITFYDFIIEKTIIDFDFNKIYLFNCKDAFIKSNNNNINFLFYIDVYIDIFINIFITHPIRFSYADNIFDCKNIINYNMYKDTKISIINTIFPFYNLIINHSINLDFMWYIEYILYFDFYIYITYFLQKFFLCLKSWICYYLLNLTETYLNECYLLKNKKILMYLFFNYTHKYIYIFDLHFLLSLNKLQEEQINFIILKKNNKLQKFIILNKINYFIFEFKRIIANKIENCINENTLSLKTGLIKYFYTFIYKNQYYFSINDSLFYFFF